MVKDATNPIEELDRCIEKLRERGERLKNREFPKDEAPKKGKEKKKEVTKAKKSYISYMKVASIVLVVGLISLWVSALTMPNFYGVIVAFLEALNPFGGVDPSNAVDFVNTLK